jgi:hypothetical protein
MFEESFEFPRKWLDKKQYVRMDSMTGLPQLVRVEPRITGNNELIPDEVEVYIDDVTRLIMSREEAEMYLVSSGCVSMDVFAKYKQGRVH